MSIKEGLHFDLPNDDYHADTEYLSSTVLKLALPEYYKAGASTAALAFGTLFHTVVLEPERLALDYAVLDPYEVGVKADGSRADNPTSTKAWKDAVAQVASEGRTLVSPEDWDLAHAMRDAVAEHEEASALLFEEPGESEVSAFWQPTDGPGRKARFDRLLDGRAVDLKSTAAKPGADALTRTVLDYGYDVSAAHYLDVAQGLELDVAAFWFVFVGKEPPHYVTVCDLSGDFLERGRALRDLAMQRMTDPAAPAYPGATGHMTLTPPPYARITPTTAGIPADFTWSLDDYA